MVLSATPSRSDLRHFGEYSGAGVVNQDVDEPAARGPQNLVDVPE